MSLGIKDGKGELIGKVSFIERIYQFTRMIPRGKVATYSQMARLAGSPKAARAVGMCMRTNPDAPCTPCHRVVASDGALTGYSAGGVLRAKKAMLLEEGVFFTGEKADLVRSQWKD
jgi:O-6-methylguanine DNA methyltransferase